ncbi:transcriptional regulator [Candidatus Thorarchaeota archaeon]|nr:MAG: transcriptional regulator [Candidatus Thorarchaeota archaeon]
MRELIVIESLCLKPLESVVQLLGRQWTIPLVFLLGNNQDGLRYSEIRESLIEHIKREISDTTLSRKLMELTDLGVLARKSFDEVPPRVQYELTESGQGLFHILNEMGDWTRDQCHAGTLRIPKENHSIK